MNPTESTRPALPAAPSTASAPTSEPGRYFRYMADFVGFTADDEQAIVASKPLIEKHLPLIVSDFYDHLLRYPPTRKFFLKKDSGVIDEAYLQLRMRHNANFWRRTSEGNYDDEYAGYIAYVGRAHTTHGADPTVYIPERYVIGQIGFVQHAVSQALHTELHDTDELLEHRTAEAWDKLLMVILEVLARAYGTEREAETFDPLVPVDDRYVAQLAHDAVGLDAPNQVQTIKRVTVARVDAIPEGERKLVDVDGISIGVFNIDGQFSALRNSCLHRGGPVCTGPLMGAMLECPWHGFQYNATNGELIIDPRSKLQTFAVHIENGEIQLEMPQSAKTV